MVWAQSFDDLRSSSSSARREHMLRGDAAECDSGHPWTVRPGPRLEWQRRAATSVLFEPHRIGDLVLRNRFVRSATDDGMADSQGHVTDPQLALIGDWERGDRHRAACISCNGCLRGLGELKPLECVVAG